MTVSAGAARRGDQLRFGGRRPQDALHTGGGHAHSIRKTNAGPSYLAHNEIVQLPTNITLAGDASDAHVVSSLARPANSHRLIHLFRCLEDFLRFMHEGKANVMVT